MSSNESLDRTTYIKDLALDARDAGLTSVPDSIGRTQHDLHTGLIKQTRQVVAPCDFYEQPLQPFEPFEPRTAFGGLLAHLRSEEWRAAPDPHWEGMPRNRSCGAAEAALRRSLLPENITNDERLSPIIIVENEEPAGIIKADGEATYYALKTDIESNRIEGSFATPQLALQPEDLPKVDHAWTVDISEVSSFHPVRLSSLLIPYAVRDDMPRGMNTFLSVAGFDHQTVVELAADALSYAQPLDLADYDTARTSD